MQDINIKLTAEVKDALEGFQAVNKNLSAIKTTSEQVQQQTKKQFDEAAKDSGNLAQQAALVNKMLDDQRKQLGDLIRYHEVLKKAQAGTNDPKKVEEYGKQIKEVDTEIKKLSNSLGGLSKNSGDAFKSLASGVAVGTLLADAFKNVMSGAVNAGKACIQAAAATEQYRISFQTLTGSLAEGNRLFDQLIKLSANTPFELPQLQEAAKSLVAFGFGTDETIKTLTSLGDISAGVGQDKLPQLVAALGKVKATTRLTGEALQSFSDAGVPLLQVLADKGGVSVRQIQKDISAGKISFEETQAAIQSMSESGGKFFGLMEKQSKSLAGQWSNLKDTMGQIASNLGTLLLPIVKSTLEGFSGLLTKVKDFVGLGSDTETTLKSNNGRFIDLIRVLKSSTASLQTKNAAIAELNQNYPELIGNVDLMHASEAALNALITKGNIALKDRIELEKIKGEQAKNQSKLIALQEVELEQMKKIEYLQTNPSKQRQQYLDAQLKSERQKLDVIREQISAVVAKDKYESTRASNLQNGLPNANTNPVVTPTDLTEEQIAAAKKYAELEKKIGDDLLKIDFDIIEKRKLQNKKGFDLDLANLQINLDRQLKILSDYENQLGNDPKAQQIRKQINRIRIKEQEDFEKAKLDLSVKYIFEAAKIRTEIEDTLLKGQQKEEAAALREYETLIDKINKLGDESEKNKLKEEATKQHFDRIREIENKYAIELATKNAKEDADELALMKLQFSNINKAEEDKFYKTKHTEEEITKFKEQQNKRRELQALYLQRAEIAIELTKQQAIAAITGTDSDKSKVDLITAQIKEIDDAIAKAIGGLQSPNDKKGTKGKVGDKNLFELLGFNKDDAAEMEKYAGKIIGYIGKVEEARIKAADSAVQAAEKQVKAAEDALDREIKLGEAGFASNVSLKRAQLEEAKKAEAAALENKKKVARTNLAIDSAQQAGAIAVAAANLYRSWATIPFGLGLLAAGAQVAGIVALIAGVVERSKAINTGYFEKGGGGRVGSDGVIIGNRHSDGGVPLEVEGGEFFATDGKRFGVVNRKMTDKHWSLLDAVNRDDKGAMFNYLNNMVELDRSFPDKFAAKQQAKITVVNQSDNSETNKLLKQVLTELQKDKSGSEITDLGDRIKIKKGNKTTILKK